MGAIADSLLESEPDLKLSLVPETLDEPEKGLIADAFKTTDQMELFDPVQAFTNIQKAEAVNPDEHAEAMKISPKVGLPADEVRYDLPAQRAKVKRDEFDFAKTLRENPVLSQNLTNADFAKIAADDIDTLSEVELRAKYSEKAESLFKQFYKDPTIAVTKGPIVAGQAAVGMLDIAITEAENAFLPYRVARESFNRIAESMGIGKIPSITERVGGKSVGQFMEENLGVKFEETHKIINTMLSPETQASMQRAQQAEGVLPTIKAYATNPAALTQEAVASWPFLVTSMGAAQSVMIRGGTTSQAMLAAHATEGLLTAGVINEQLQGEGIDPEKARKYAAAAGLFTGLIGYGAGKLGLGDAVESFLVPRKTLAPATTAGVVRRAATEGIKGFIQEGILEEGPQNVSERIFENLAKGRPALEGAGTAYGQGVIIGGPIGMTMNTIRSVGDNLAAIDHARQSHDYMQALGDQAKASKLRERAPDQFKRFLKMAAEDGPVDNVYVPVDKLEEYFQTNEIDMEEVFTTIDGIEDQIAQARETQSDVVIPLADYVTHIATMENHDALLQDIRLDPLHITAREAALMEENLPELVEEYIQIEQEKALQDEQKRESFDVMFDTMREIQIKAGVSPTIATAQATLAPQLFSMIEAKYGLDALKEFTKRGIVVQMPDVVEMAMRDDLDVFIDRVRQQKRPKQAEIYGKSLIEMLTEKGGIQDEGGELSARDAQKWRGGMYNRQFVNAQGLSLDAARETAIQEGYLSEGDDINELLSAIDQELRGEPVYAPQNIDQTAMEGQQEAQDLIDYLNQRGYDLASMTNEDVKAALREETLAEPEEDMVEYDQSGNLITDSPAFKEWFGDSKVVDENGDPLVVYHGSGVSDIQVFDAGKAGEVQVSDWGKGIYFALSKPSAEYYAKEAVSRNQDPVGDKLYDEYEAVARKNGTRPMYEWMDLGSKTNDQAKQKQYKEIKEAEEKWLSHKEKFEKENRGEVYPAYLSIKNPLIYTYVGITEPDLHLQAIEGGHDGIFVVHERDSDETFLDTIEEIIAFSPNQIKSVNNRGTFDATDPRILYQTVQGNEVNIEAIENETGKILTFKEDASVALQEIDQSMNTLQALIECVGA